MTDKQIKKLNELTEMSQELGLYEDRPDWRIVLLADHIKRLEEKLKAKEQEYEELRQYHNKCCEEFEKGKKEWLEKYNQISRGFYNGDYCNTENCSLLKAKEQECEGLNKYLHKNFEEKDKLHLIIDRLLEASGYDTNTASAEDFEDVYKNMRYEKQQLDQLKAENDKYSLFIEKLCDYAGLECNSEEQAMRTLSDFARQMNKARWIIDRYKQTLAEIKPILELYANSKMGEEQPDRTYKIMLSGGYIMVYDPKPARQALQKISEVEND